MSNNDNSNKLSRYEELFDNKDKKAEAFDLIAEQYYNKNFGCMTKSDFETLLFHIYIEQVLAKSEENFASYSDFRLGKELGISQSKVSNLKVRKQLQYPREFKWREAFAKVSKNVNFENGKIKIQIPDINLYFEIKNAIEEAGGFVDVSLTPRLLQVSPCYFLDLIVAVSEEKDRDRVKKTIRKIIREKDKDKEFLEAEPFGKQLKGLAKDHISVIFTELITEFTSSPISFLTMLISNVGNAISGLS